MKRMGKKFIWTLVFSFALATVTFIFPQKAEASWLSNLAGNLVNGVVGGITRNILPSNGGGSGIGGTITNALTGAARNMITGAANQAVNGLLGGGGGGGGGGAGNLATSFINNAGGGVGGGINPVAMIMNLANGGNSNALNQVLTQFLGSSNASLVNAAMQFLNSQGALPSSLTSQIGNQNYTQNYLSGTNQPGGTQQAFNQLPPGCAIANGQIYCSSNTGAGTSTGDNPFSQQNFYNQQPTVSNPQGVGWVPNPNNPLGLPVGVSLPPGVGGPYYVDTCTNPNGDYSNPTVTIAGQTLKNKICANSNSLRVFACYDNNTAFTLDIPCQGGCANDICSNETGQTIQNPVSTNNWQNGSPTCMDSDGGYNLNERGYVNQPGYGQDECRSGTDIIENMCDAFGLPVRYVDTCPNGCSDGACLSESGAMQNTTINYVQCKTDYTCDDGFRAYTSNSSSTSGLPPCFCVPDVTTTTTTTTTLPPTPAPQICAKKFEIKNGFNTVVVSDLYRVDSFTKAGMTVYDFLWTGDKHWRFTGESDFGPLQADVGYYVYNPGPDQEICAAKGTGGAKEIILKQGWNLLANSSDGAQTLSQISLRAVNVGAANDCASASCSSATTPKQLFEGSASTRRAYYKISVIKDGSASDPHQAYETITVTSENLDSVTIPAGKAYWLYLFE